MQMGLFYLKKANRLIKFSKFGVKFEILDMKVVGLGFLEIEFKLKL